MADGLRAGVHRATGEFRVRDRFSDPKGEKLEFFISRHLQRATPAVLCFIGISGPKVCEQRVAMRISQGGHEVPGGKLIERFPRILANLKSALGQLRHVWVFDNDNLRKPFRLSSQFFENGAIKRE